MHPLLQPVHDLLKDPAHWLKQGCVRDSKGKMTNVEDPDAVKFCLVYAVYRCYPDDSATTAKITLALQTRVRELGHRTVMRFNDHHSTSHGGVLKVLETTVID